jgi:hypothetical protein
MHPKTRCKIEEPGSKNEEMFSSCTVTRDNPCSVFKHVSIKHSGAMADKYTSACADGKARDLTDHDSTDRRQYSSTPE